MSSKHLLASITVLCFSSCLFAQDKDLLKMLNDSISVNDKHSPVTGTFKALHIVNMQTIEAPARGALNFIIMHRFGQLNSGSYNLYGLDNATLRLGLDYGITDRLAVGIGRSSYQKMLDAYIKYRLLRQTEGGDHNMPVSASIIGGITDYTDINYPKGGTNYSVSYFGQLLIARKINRNLSIELSPTWVHYNLVPSAADKFDEFAIGAGARMKITKRMSLNVEYNYLLPNQIVSMAVHNSLSMGLDIETGGHVFQLVFSNSQGMTEPQYVGRTTESWGNGGIYFGFNVSRNFNISNHAKARKAK